MIEMKVSGKVGIVDFEGDIISFSVVVDNESKDGSECVICTRRLRGGEFLDVKPGDEVTVRGEPVVEICKNEKGDFKTGFILKF